MSERMPRVAMDARNDLLLQAALEYAGYGWRVVPLRDGKIPRIKAWQREATIDEEKIVAWWEQWPGSNLGVKLGPDSGIVDVECDSPEAEQLLLKLFNNDPPVTPTFQSSRGKHRLFRWRPDLPQPEKNSFSLGKLEIRTGNGEKGAQSVFPPSRHPLGLNYAWLVPPDECEVADFSQVAFAALWNATPEDLLGESVAPSSCVDVNDRARRYLAKIPPAISGQRGHDATFRVACVLVLGFAMPVGEALPLLEEYNATCEPPWGENELLHKLEDADKQPGERGYLLARTRAVAAKPAAATPAASGDSPPDGWRLVIVESKPLELRLYSPNWSGKTPEGYIKLTTDQYHSPDAIRRQATEQARVYLTRQFCKLWDGDRETPSLARILMESAETIPAPLEKQRDRVVAELLYEQLSKAKSRQVPEDSEPDSQGRPCVMQDGSIVFKFNVVWEPLARGDSKVKREELAEIMERIDAKDRVFGSKMARRRFKILSAKAIDRLEALADI